MTKTFVQKLFDIFKNCTSVLHIRTKIIYLFRYRLIIFDMMTALGRLSIGSVTGMSLKSRWCAKVAICTSIWPSPKSSYPACWILISWARPLEQNSTQYCNRLTCQQYCKCLSSLVPIISRQRPCNKCSG